MNLRHLALYFVIFSLSVYAWKDWFKSLCGLILLMAIIEHEDMPKTMFGIQGLNLWNILCAVIIIVWLVNRSREGLKWDMPRYINFLLLLYLGVVIFGFLRAMFDIKHIEGYSLKSLISDELINTIKWVLPGILLYDGCRSRKRILMAISCLLVMFFLLAIQVINRLPASSILQTGGQIVETRRACSDIGYSAVDMSVLLAGAFWSMIAILQMLPNKKYKALVLAAAVLVAFGQALTGGRAGYVAWGATGFVLCLMKWRKYLLLTPFVVILLLMVFPGAVERMFTGFGATDITGQSTTDTNAVTSDRMIIWSYVIDKISESPIIGYGRRAMDRTGLEATLEYEYPGIGATQPHNMYLETLLDNGILGSIPIILFWLVFIVYAGRLFRSSNRLCSTVGGVTLSLMLAQLFAGIGSQHFYPEESTLGAWAAMFLTLRVYLEKQYTQTSEVPMESSWNSSLKPEVIGI